MYVCVQRSTFVRPRSVVISRLVLFFRTSLICEQVFLSNKSYFRTSLIFEQVLFSFEMFNFCNMYFIFFRKFDFSKQVLFFARVRHAIHLTGELFVYVLNSSALVKIVKKKHCQISRTQEQLKPVKESLFVAQMRK